ncbi:MAG: type I-E CRISPR-associated endoribonuclease Cas2 [Thermomicrobiales bacterium]|nr:type I-E CRISPR-associated endoribonuclease Cas2 [Thermomicrobiales bacterium]
MIVLVLERVTTSLRGELTRWLLEVRAGVFVGTVSAEVRGRLWERACKGRGSGAGVLLHRAPTEQGFAVHVCGEPGREIVDFEGLTLVRMPQ